MEARTALLRIISRAARASAALVARTSDDAPIAVWGCDSAAARSLLHAVRRAGVEGPVALILPLRLRDGSPGELILAAPDADADRVELAAFAAEIGLLCDPSDPPEDADGLATLIRSVDRIGEAIAILRTPAMPSESPTIVALNEEFTRLFGYAGEAIGKPAEILWGPLTDRSAMGVLRAQTTARRTARTSVVLYTRGGDPRWTELVSTVADPEAVAMHQVVVCRDVTSRKLIMDAFSAEKRRFSTTLGGIAEAVVTVMADGVVDYVNEAAESLLGVTLADAYGAQPGDVMTLLDADAQPIDVLPRVGGESVLRGRGILRTADGSTDVAYVASRIGGDHGTVIILRDVTAEHRLTMRLSFEAAHDSLTGLQNRRAFLERLDDAVTGARDRGEHHAVAYIDLDRFKAVNDRFGHATGDRVLIEIGRVMGRVVRGGDMLARLGGDEFACLLTNCRLDDARHVAEKLRAGVEEWRAWHEGNTLEVGVSIGLAPIDGASAPEEVLAAADAACYQAKAAGRNTVYG
jgi:ammonium transporter, Amt family